MTVRTLIFTGFFLLARSSVGMLTGGELDAVRDSVRNADDSDEKPRLQRRPERQRNHCEDKDQSNSDSTNLVVYLGAQILASPWSVPLWITGDDYTQAAAVVPQPYSSAPFAMRGEEIAQEELPAVFGRLQLDYGTNFDDLQRSGGQLLLETPSRFGLDTSWTSWWERTLQGTDNFQLGDANLVFRFAQSEDLQFRTGLGVNWLADGAAGDVGFNFTHGFDYYPRKPLVISSTIDIGTLGHAGLFHNQTTVGVIYRQCEFFTGFDYYHIGHGELSGWISGIRWRF